MKESYVEGLAIYTSLESCGIDSNVIGEALTEGGTGEKLVVNEIRTTPQYSN